MEYSLCVLIQQLTELQLRFFRHRNRSKRENNGVGASCFRKRSRGGVVERFESLAKVSSL
jgi:hypothetical protein